MNDQDAMLAAGSSAPACSTFRCLECGAEVLCIGEYELVTRRWSWRKFRSVVVVRRPLCRVCFEELSNAPNQARSEAE